MNEKYDLVPEGELFRLVAKTHVRHGVGEGCRGGLVASDRNLSTDGASWIFRGAVVRGNALVTDNATVRGNSLITGCTTIMNNAVVNDSRVWGDTQIAGQARLDWASVSGIELYHGVLGEGAVVESPNHLLVTSVPGTDWILTLFRTGTGHAIRVGCQTTTLEHLNAVADEYASHPLEHLLKLWLPMAQALVSTWRPVRVFSSYW